MTRSLLIAVVILAIAVVAGVFILFGGNQTRTQVVGLGGPDTASAPAEETNNGTTPRGDEASNFAPSATKYPELAAVTDPSSAEEYLAVHPTDIVIGNPGAPVTIVEFFSFNCGFCKQFHDEAYQQVLANFINRGLVKVIKREYLLQRDFIGLELLAGAGAQCFLDSEQYKVFADLMFDRQGRLDRNNPADALVPLFTQAGLDEVQARACMAEDQNRTLVFMRAVQAQAILGVSATPTLYINGQRYTGTVNDYAQLSEALRTAAN